MATESDPLEAFIDESIRLSVNAGYNPIIFQRMRRHHRTVGAVTKLVESGDIQSGFLELKKRGLLDWSIEAAVLKFPERFTRRTRECAEFRLKHASDRKLKRTK